jgi:hypothetical protein
MSIRSYGDVVRTYNDHNDLVRRIYKLLKIYKTQKVLNIPKFEYLRIKAVEENQIVVELLRIHSYEVTHFEEIVDEMAGPPGMGIGWEPSGEDIIGSREVVDGYNRYVKVVDTINIPENDVGLSDDSELEQVEKCYESKRKEKERQEEKIRLSKEIKKREEELHDLENELSELKL